MGDVKMKSITRIHLVLATCGMLALMGFLAPASAHHGGALEWDFGKNVGPVTGTATQFGFRFPHVQIFVDVPGENGEVQNFVFVTRWTPTILRDHGWRRTSIEPGDEVIVTYTPHLTNPTAGTISRLEVTGELLEINFE
jgi:hypothetical protein